MKLIEYIKAVEEALGKKAIQISLPLQIGDVPKTYADSSKLSQTFDYQPATSVREGVTSFVNWYQNDYLSTS